MKVILFLLLFIGITGVTVAQDQIREIGNVEKLVQEKGTLDITTTGAKVQISIYSPSVIRIRIGNRALQEDFSYALIAKPLQKEIQTRETGSQIVFQTDSIRCAIDKSPFLVHFYTPDGKLINEDEKGLGVSWIGNEVTNYKHFQDGERFIGLGEKTGNLDRTGSAYTNWNSDVYGYAASADPLYTTIPFYIGIHHGLNYGIFFDNSFQSDFNFGASNNRFSSFGARGGEMNYYFIYNTTVAGIIRSYTDITGRMKMPPLWSLGYQQNRYSYYPETEVYRIAQTLREKKIPADGITLDIHYMDAYKLFTWNKERFPDPLRMTDSLKKMGFRTTVIVDPGIKVESGYAAYESGLKNDIFLKYNDGKPYTGEVWPGWCHFPDFTSEKGREWWMGQLKQYTSAGVSGIWNDMNEIATWGQKMPSNVNFNYDGHGTTHLKGHNVFGMQMARSSYEGTRKLLQKRPFILTRSGYAGLQRYAALWTGDNRAEDDHMLAGVRLLNSLGISGVPFAGMDIGGFTGNPSAALYTRWMQLGAFIPYYRNHTALNTKSAEPWSFGEDVLDITRSYINLRYKLLPYIYSAFYEASQNGMPVMRSLAINYTGDKSVYNTAFQNEYLFGQAFLVMPQTSTQSFAKIYLPEGTWYNLYNDKKDTGNAEKLIELDVKMLPVYVKGGSIIPVQSLVQSVMEKPSDTLELHVYNGLKENVFEYYEDDGDTYDYEQGTYYARDIRFDPAAGTVTLKKVKGNSGSKFKFIRLFLHGFESGNLSINGLAGKAREDEHSFLGNTGEKDPQYIHRVKNILLKNEANEIIIQIK